MVDQVALALMGLFMNMVYFLSSWTEFYEFITLFDRDVNFEEISVAGFPQVHSTFKLASQQIHYLRCILIAIVGPRWVSILYMTHCRSFNYFPTSTCLIVLNIFHLHLHISGLQCYLSGFTCWRWFLLLKKHQCIYNWRQTNCLRYTQISSSGKMKFVILVKLKWDA